MITDINQLDLNKKYTYADYLQWGFKERVELIKGRVFKMSPAPSVKHQQVSRNLLHFLDALLWKQPCQLFHAPFDVKLNKKGKDTVVQPDICVVCEVSKLDEQSCNGAPDLIIEILSPGNSRKERKEKFELYEENEVKEYWLVDISENSVTVYTLNEHGRYIGSKPYVTGERPVSAVLPDLNIPLTEVFE
ncbi:Uma2 family endonuclease [Phaeodactylibacter luteus]|uniref:Uma2 family endonuclease n=1 Tax=Phaeodactylibacter luteus TaxID=1564516 RepID=A0A5C6RN55_9BACT|nr:Uma2 family endonuclease [Phaeodactylibacter luteus]TXB63781.1 Uma2 family endonuclease [Phaeodactylibacter luteus]